MAQGREFEPTEEQKKTVRGMAGYGIPHEGIATILNIDAKTLRKHFRRELDLGSVQANAKVAQSLFNMATEDKNVAAAIFWLKIRANWREKIDINVTSEPRELSDEDLLAIISGKQTKLIEGSAEEIDA